VLETVLSIGIDDSGFDMKRFQIAYLFILAAFVPGELHGQGVSFSGKKLTQVVDFTDGGITTVFGSYATITKAQIAGNSVVFSAYGGADLDELAILSADGVSVVPLLELGAGPLANDVSLRLGDFRYLGDGVTLRIPVTAQAQNDFPRLAFLSEGNYLEVAGPSTIVPGSVDDRFTQYLGVVSYDDEIAFVGVTRDGKRGVYLASGGSIHDLSDRVMPEEELVGSGIGNRVIFDGTTVSFFYQGGEEGSPKDLYGSTLNGAPFFVAAGAGEVNDEGVMRNYQAREVFSGGSGEVIFLAEIADDSIHSQWAFLQSTARGLKIVARSSSLAPIDGRSAGLSGFWNSFFDGVSSFVGGVSQVYGDLEGAALTPKLQVFAGSPPMVLVDIEAGNSALVEVSATPKRLWAELGIVGPVEIPVAPEPQVVASGETAIFNVVAEGLGPFAYQWYLNGEFLPLSTTATLTLRNVSLDNVGSVRVVVSNESDSQEAFASLDVSEPPEVILLPSDRQGIIGEAIEVLFQTRGQRPITYELVEAPEGSSLGIVSIQPGAVFEIHAVRSDALTLGDSGRYTVRALSPAGVAELSFNLSVGGIPPNPEFQAKRFEFLSDHHAAELLAFPNGLSFNGPVVFDDENDRFLTSPLVDSSDSFFAISSDGTTEPILDGNALQGISNPVMIGFLAEYGIVFQGTQTSQNRMAVLSHQNGFTSTLVSGSDLQNELGLGPDFSRFEFQIQNGGLVGLVEGSGSWAVVRVGDVITELVSSNEATPIANAEGYLGCDEQFRPLFHTGFQAAPGNPTRTYGPVIRRIESNGLVTTLQTGFLPLDQTDPSREVKAVPSNTGVKFLAWGERLVEMIDKRLQVHQITETDTGKALFLPKMAEGYASKYRVFFPGLLVEDHLSKEEFAQLGFTTRESDSIRRQIFSWSVAGIEEAFSGRYLTGIRANAGGLGRESLKLLNVVGDQLLVSGQIESEGPRSFLMLNQAPDLTSTVLAFQRSRDGFYLDIPMGTRLILNPSLIGPWSPVPSKAGSFVIPRNADKQFYSVIPK